MIEIICKDDPQKTTLGRAEDTVFLPKNIRQVGSPRGRHRIYLEDYVYTYLRSAARDNETCTVVFLGKGQVVKDIRYTFVSGLVDCGEAVFQWENISLDESFWDYIYKEQKQFFSELEIVGWALGRTGGSMDLTPAVEAAHRKYFAGRDKILMLIDILEGEEQFFIYEQGYLQKREGFYIYYEKNLAMQEYMIYKREEDMRIAKLKGGDSPAGDDKEETERLFSEDDGETGQGPVKEMGQTEPPNENTAWQDIESAIRTEEWQDSMPVSKEPKTQAEEALESYRKMLLERQGKREQSQNRRFLYTASSFFLVVLCVIGITTINNYRKMQKVEDVLNVINHDKDQAPSDGKPEEAKGEEVKADGDPLVVETVDSQIEPLEPDADRQDDAQEGSGAKDTEGEEESPDSANKDSSLKPAESNGQDASGELPAGEAQESSVKPMEDAQGEAQGGSAKPTEDAQGEAQESSVKPTEDAQEAAAGEKKYYTVQAGDTLNSICLEIYKTKDMVKKLKEVNDIEDGDKILIGQKLLLP